MRIYAAIRNNTGADITGTIIFYDNQSAISQTPVAALDGRIIESWADWTPTTGHHVIAARLTAVESHAIGQPAETISIADANATSTIAVAPPPPPKVIPSPTASTTTHDQTGTTTTNTVAVPFVPQSGLEQYLPASPVTTALDTVTTITNHAKQALDTYRAKQAAAQTPTVGLQQLDIPVNQNGFGTITRSMAQAKPAAQIPNDAFGTALHATGAALAYAWNGLLSGLSWTLGYPALIQFLLLLGIIVTLYRLARRYGRRRFL